MSEEGKIGWKVIDPNGMNKNEMLCAWGGKERDYVSRGKSPDFWPSLCIIITN